MGQGVGPVGPGRRRPGPRPGSPSCWSLTLQQCCEVSDCPAASPPRPSSGALAQLASPGRPVLPGAPGSPHPAGMSGAGAASCRDAVGSGRGLGTEDRSRPARWLSGPRASARSPGRSASSDRRVQTQTRRARMCGRKDTHAGPDRHTDARAARRPLRHTHLETHSG